MKINEFVNSKDIKEHWVEIGYEPSALEAAWLIWQSKNHNVEEKHKAWMEIIEKADDCNIPDVEWAKRLPSLHEFLKRYISIEENLISSFYKTEDNAVFSYRMYFDDDGDRDWYNVSAFFRTFEEAYEHSKDDGESPHPKFIEFVKTYIGVEEKQIFVRLNLDKELVRVEETNFLIDDNDFDVFRGFSEMNFEFPLPFKKGDIIKRVRGLYTRNSYADDKYVFEASTTEHGYTVVKGYCADRDGEVMYENIHMYMDLEFDRSPLIKEDKLLTPISKYLRGEIDLALLLGAYRHILCSNEAKMINLYMNYTKEKKKLAGINDE